LALHVTIVGATGAVGRKLISLLDQSRLPVSQISPVASARSVGQVLETERIPITPVAALESFAFAGADVAFFSAGAEVSRQFAPLAAAAGCLVIDNSSAFRDETDVPLAVPEVNPDVLERRPERGIVANPNCSTIQLVRAVAPLHAAFGLTRLVVSTYQAASGGGLRGVAELANDSAEALRRHPRPAAAGHSEDEQGRFGMPLAFSLVPQIGPLDSWGIAHEERKLRYETRKILRHPSLRVDATAVRVGVFNCHSEAVLAEFGQAVDAQAARRVLAAARDLVLYRPDGLPPYPTPLTVQQAPDINGHVHVGRVRGDPENPQQISLWVVADNLTVGAALNAMRILELAATNGWLDAVTARA
jgi:aspartate-semialdehyde dehydrogenase